MNPAYLESAEEFQPASQSELSRFVAENARNRRSPLAPVGGRTALHVGYPFQEESIAVCTTKLSQVVDYPARDMTITVEAGIRMQSLIDALAAEHQQLPIDVPQARRATLGGVIATNTSGPRRFGYGTLRDYVIGISAVDADGRLFQAGGRVVKNVAGYDLCKLLVGSLGTLAILTQVTLKLRPIPERTEFLWGTFPHYSGIDAALERLLTSAARPTVLEVLTPKAARQTIAEAKLDLPPDKPVLCIGVEGSEREVDFQAEALKHELAEFSPHSIERIPGEGGERLLSALTDFPADPDDPLTFQANLLPSRSLEFLQEADRLGATALAHAGNGIVIGHLPDEAGTLDRARQILEPLQNLASQHRGNLVILQCDSEWKTSLPLFGKPEPSWELMKRLKATLDPQGLLNPGRFLDGGITFA